LACRAGFFFRALLRRDPIGLCVARNPMKRRITSEIRCAGIMPYFLFNMVSMRTTSFRRSCFRRRRSFHPGRGIGGSLRLRWPILGINLLPLLWLEWRRNGAAAPFIGTIDLALTPSRSPISFLFLWLLLWRASVDREAIPQAYRSRYDESTTTE